MSSKKSLLTRKNLGARTSRPLSEDTSKMSLRERAGNPPLEEAESLGPESFEESSDYLFEERTGRPRTQEVLLTQEEAVEHSVLPLNVEARRRFQRAAAQKPKDLSSNVSSWKSRGYIPHFDKSGLIQNITIRLGDSLPREFLERCERDLARLSSSKRDLEKRKRIDAMLDRGLGECHLKDSRVAAMVEEAFLFFDCERYEMIRWCIMPNHAHIVLETYASHPLARVLKSWKSYTSKEANKILRREGRFWQADYFDRFIRDDDHFKNVIRYIDDNPVKAGLVEQAEDWRWSSAWKGRK